MRSHAGALPLPFEVLPRQVGRDEHRGCDGCRRLTPRGAPERRGLNTDSDADCHTHVCRDSRAECVPHSECYPLQHSEGSRFDHAHADRNSKAERFPDTQRYAQQHSEGNRVGYPDTHCDTDFDTDHAVHPLGRNVQKHFLPHRVGIALRERTQLRDLAG